MTPWTRDDTKKWIGILEGRLKDINYYLDKTHKWCEENYIHDDYAIFMCCFLTCIWVSQLRDESITYTELMELLGAEEVKVDEEKMYELTPEYLELEHDELMHKIIKTLEKNGFWG
jgi:hypothetical protein